MTPISLDSFDKYGTKCIINTIQKLLAQYSDIGDARNSMRWCDILGFISPNTLLNNSSVSGDIDATFYRAKLLFHMGNIQECYHLCMNNYSPTKYNWVYLLVSCSLRLGKYEEGFNVIKSIITEKNAIDTCATTLSSILLIQGDLSISMENDHLALESYISALKYSPFNILAFEAIIYHHLLSPTKQELLLKDTIQCTDSTISDFLSDIYSILLDRNKYMTGKERIPSIIIPSFHNLFLLVEHYYYHYQYEKAYSFSIQLLSMKDQPDYYRFLVIYIAICYELGYSIPLYELSHQLVQNDSNHPISWYSIGTYYLLKKKYEESRRFYGRITLSKHGNNIRSQIPEAWIGFGHSFSNAGEHDQAISAYKTAAMLMKNSPYPWLYLAMSYYSTRSDHPNIISCLQHAYELAPKDPIILNELGNWYSNQHVNELNKARTYFQDAWTSFSNSDSYPVGPVASVLYNLGTIHLRQHQYDLAYEFYKKASIYAPRQFKILLGLGISCHALKNTELASDYYQQCLVQIHPSDSTVKRQHNNADLSSWIKNLLNNAMMDQYLE